MEIKSDQIVYSEHGEDRGATPIDSSDSDPVVEKELAGLAHDLRDIANAIRETNQNNDKILRLLEL